jgi:hypothetical protein
MNQSFLFTNMKNLKTINLKDYIEKQITIKIYFIPIQYQSKSHFNFFKIKLNKK